MNARTTLWTSLGLCALALGASAALYPRLPEEVATHWNAAGVVDGWSSRGFAAVLLPGAMLLTWLLFQVLPSIAPSGWRVEPFRAAWDKVQLGLLAFLALLHLGLLGSALGWFASGFDRFAIGGVGLLLMLVGNYLGKTTRNFFFGIRTPWTLASDEVWRRTHRLGGWLMVGAGVVLCAMAWSGLSPALLVATLLVAVLVPVVYSYFAYRALEGFAPAVEPRDDDPD